MVIIAMPTTKAVCFFLAPNQLVGTVEYNRNTHCYILLVHPDLLLWHPLAKKIKQYGYFSYSSNEALHLSETERQIILSIYQIMEQELNNRFDEFSQEVIIAQLELMLSYVNRFYKRQFITRNAVNKDTLHNTERILDEYLDQKTLELGVPTVQYVADQLLISSGYLSDMLRSLIGKGAKQYIHEKLIESKRKTEYHRIDHK